MTGSIEKISESSVVADNGAGSAGRREKRKRSRRDPDHDSVFISDEARRRSAADGELPPGF